MLSQCYKEPLPNLRAAFVVFGVLVVGDWIYGKVVGEYDLLLGPYEVGKVGQVEPGLMGASGLATVATV